jgi:hypothetical protein
VSSKISFQSNSGLPQPALDGGDSAAFSSFFLLPNRIHAPAAANANRWAAKNVRIIDSLYGVLKLIMKVNSKNMLVRVGFVSERLEE